MEEELESDDDDNRSIATSIVELSTGKLFIYSKHTCTHVLVTYLVYQCTFIDNRSFTITHNYNYTEITIKQQLINQLEKAQKSLNSLRSQYEEKMVLLQNQIRVTEAERDKFIKDISKAEMN